MAEKKIKILPGGPYQIDADIPLQNAVIETSPSGTSERWADGKTHTGHLKADGTADAPYHLCRCGHSKNKPYCDGAHSVIGFEGTERAAHSGYAKGSKIYEGGTLDLMDNEELCASMRFCDRAKGVWQAAIDSDDAASRELAIEEACNCAAGRLTVVEKDGTPIEPPLEAGISPIDDTAAGRRGPLWAKGGLQLEGADGQRYELRNRMTLCRCGESKNMPFCDISHMNCPHMEGFDE